MDVDVTVCVLAGPVLVDVRTVVVVAVLVTGAGITVVTGVNVVVFLTVMGIFSVSVFD